MSELRIPSQRIFLSRRHTWFFLELPFSPPFVHIFSVIEHLEHFTIMSANSATWIEMGAPGSVSDGSFSSSSGLYFPTDLYGE